MSGIRGVVVRPDLVPVGAGVAGGGGEGGIDTTGASAVVGGKTGVAGTRNGSGAGLAFLAAGGGVIMGGAISEIGGTAG